MQRLLLRGKFVLTGKVVFDVKYIAKLTACYNDSIKCELDL